MEWVVSGFILGEPEAVTLLNQPGVTAIGGLPQPWQKMSLHGGATSLRRQYQARPVRQVRMLRPKPGEGDSLGFPWCLGLKCQHLARVSSRLRRRHGLFDTKLK